MAVDVAYDGVEAATKLELATYHVVVLDRGLPGLSGNTLCGRIAESRRSTMVLILTGAAAPEERVTGLLLGADDYLAKPFHLGAAPLEGRHAAIGITPSA
jgi:DNA-binding response OmpR family regulator